jgi:hypothetical protein
VPETDGLGVDVEHTASSADAFRPGEIWLDVDGQPITFRNEKFLHVVRSQA